MTGLLTDADRARLLEHGCQTAAGADIDPRPVSGEQERLENLVNRHIWAAR